MTLVLTYNFIVKQFSDLVRDKSYEIFYIYILYYELNLHEQCALFTNININKNPLNVKMNPDIYQRFFNCKLNLKLKFFFLLYFFITHLKRKYHY